MRALHRLFVLITVGIVGAIAVVPTAVDAASIKAGGPCTKAQLGRKARAASGISVTCTLVGKKRVWRADEGSVASPSAGGTGAKGAALRSFSGELATFVRVANPLPEDSTDPVTYALVEESKLSLTFSAKTTIAAGGIHVIDLATLTGTGTIALNRTRCAGPTGSFPVTVRPAPSLDGTVADSTKLSFTNVFSFSWLQTECAGAVPLRFAPCNVPSTSSPWSADGAKLNFTGCNGGLQTGDLRIVG